MKRHLKLNFAFFLFAVLYVMGLCIILAKTYGYHARGYTWGAVLPNYGPFGNLVHYISMPLITSLLLGGVILLLLRFLWPDRKAYFVPLFAVIYALGDYSLSALHFWLTRITGNFLLSFDLGYILYRPTIFITSLFPDLYGVLDPGFYLAMSVTSFIIGLFLGALILAAKAYFEAKISRNRSGCPQG